MRRVLTSLLVIVAVAPAPGAAAAPRQRFFTMGDGTLQLRSTKNRHRFSGRYRRRDGRYIRRALAQINRVFGADHARAERRISLRFIELLSHLRRSLKGRWITISSGFRSPRYNRALRDKGGIVAKSSLHQYGMAADLKLGGVRSRALWEHVRRHKLGGAGYYGGPWIHLDVGRPRSWTGGTANVRSGASDHNKRIILVPELDIYAPGEELSLRFARMTAWPIGVKRTFALERAVDGETFEAVRTFRPALGRRKETCPAFTSVAQMIGISWRLPAGLQPGRYRVRATFCDARWEAMPAEVRSFTFRVAPTATTAPP